MCEFEKELDILKEKNTFRQIPNISNKKDTFVKIDGKTLLNFSSNDYLNLSTNKNLITEFVQEHSNSPELQFSSASARLLSGTTSVYKELETTLANLFKKESALIFNTGYQCNLGVISTLAKRGDLILSDKLNHASIIDGMKLSEAEFKRYKHLDYKNLEELLQKHRNDYKKVLIVSESVFSMDGDIADISKLIELKKKYNCLLMIDEAHAFCAVGKGLTGVSQGIDIDILTATFGKAVGSFGAFAVANKTIINYLINKARSFIFSTSIPPINIAWTNWLLTKKLDFLYEQKLKLEKNIEKTHQYLKENNLKTISQSQIIPIVLGADEKAVKTAEQLRNLGYFVLPIRPPTVPPNTSRLRLSLTSDLEFEQIKGLIDYVKNEL